MWNGVSFRDYSLSNSIPSNAISEGESCGSDVNNGCDDNFKLYCYRSGNTEDDDLFMFNVYSWFRNKLNSS